jgi:hypothetical protein
VGSDDPSSHDKNWNLDDELYGSHSREREPEGDEHSPPSDGAVSALKKNPYLAVGVGGGALLVLVIVGVVVALNWGSKPPVRKAPANSQSRQRPPTPAPPKTSMSSASPGDKDAKGGLKTPPVKALVLPEDVSKWRKAEFVQAKRERHRLLTAAVAHLGKEFAGGNEKADAAAGLLGMLLRPEEPDENGEPASKGPPRPTGPMNPAIVKAILEALAINNSPTARGIIMGVINGSTLTENDKAAAETAMEILARSPTSETTDLFYRLATSPDEVRAAGTGTVTAAELQAKAFPLLMQIRSPALRLKLASYALDPGAQPKMRDPIVQQLIKPEVENAESQWLLLQQGENSPLAAQAKASLEKQLGDFTSACLGRFLGIPLAEFGGMGATSSAAPSASGAKQPIDVGAAALLAKLYWNEAALKVVQDRLANMESFQKEPVMTSVAAAIPMDACRASLLDCLSTHHAEGPQTLTAAMSRVCFEPGFLVVLKSVDRRHPEPKPAAVMRRPPSSSTRPPSGASRPKARPQPGSSEAEKNEEKWNDACEQMVKLACKRFLAAAKALRASGQGPKPEELAEKRPFELHKDARVVAEYHAEWPDAMPAKDKLGDLTVDPLKVHYVRIEQKDRPRPVSGHYRAKTASKETYNITSGYWLESCRRVPKEGTKISVDVFVNLPKQVAAKAAQGADEGSDEVMLSVDVLYIEIKDPHP